MRTTSNKIRQITDGAVITALYCVFLLISRLTGTSLEYELYFLMPLPVALYAYKYDFKTSWIPGCAVTIVSAFICTNPLNSLVYVLPSVLIGILYGGFFAKKDIRPIISILLITLISFISELLSSIVLSKILGIADIFAEINELITDFSNILSNLHMNSMNMSFVQALMEGLVPSILILISLIEAVLIYLIFNLFLLKSKMFASEEKPKNFKLIKAPMWLGIIYLVSIPLTIVCLNYFEYSNDFVHFLIVFEVNLNIILTMIFIYFGLKTAALYCRAKKKMWLIIFVYLFIFIFPLQFLIALLGTADSFYNLNNRIINKYLTQN